MAKLRCISHPYRERLVQVSTTTIHRTKVREVKTPALYDPIYETYTCTIVRGAQFGDEM